MLGLRLIGISIRFRPNFKASKLLKQQEVVGHICEVTVHGIQRRQYETI